MYPTSPGLFHEPPPELEPAGGGPIGIVADTYDQALDYILASPMPSPWVVILEPAHIAGRALGGLALLKTEPLSEEMKTALTRACLG